MRTFLCSVILIFASLSLAAQNVVFETDAPSVVAAGEAFTISYELSARPEEGSFVVPSFDDAFNVLAGPSISQGSQMSVDFNTGNAVRKEVYAFTFVLQTDSPGRFTIPAAKVKVDGKVYSAKSRPIEVVSAEAMSSGGQQNLAPDDILARVFVDRTEVYKGQPVRAIFKIYSRVMCDVNQPKYPAFDGFYVQDINSGSKPQHETYNNKVYQSLVVRDALLYPTQSGVLHIDQATFGVSAQLVQEKPLSGDPLFDGFFGGASSVREVRVQVSSPPVQITVRELPAGAPASFTGAVGRFQLSGGMSNPVLNANASGTYMLKVSGNGNLPLVAPPKITLPSAFDQYAVKTADHYNAAAAGIAGYREFEYPFIARAEGAYEIDSAEFSYFDPEKGQYVTLATEAQSIDIHPDPTGGDVAQRGIVSGSVPKEELKILDQDIRFIHVGDAKLRRKGGLFFLSGGYFAVLTGLSVVAVAAYLFMRKYLRDMADTTLVRNKKANKIALQRLKAASEYLQKEDKGGFYEEMLRALWGYMSDKMNIPVANLTKDNMREELLRREIAPEKAGAFVELISECEYAQYSPGSTGKMNEVYKSAAVMLSKLESAIK